MFGLAVLVMYSRANDFLIGVCTAYILYSSCDVISVKCQGRAGNCKFC